MSLLYTSRPILFQLGQGKTLLILLPILGSRLKLAKFFITHRVNNKYFVNNSLISPMIVTMCEARYIKFCCRQIDVKFRLRCPAYILLYP